MMKKMLVLILVLAVAVLTACGRQEVAQTEPSATTAAPSNRLVIYSPAGNEEFRLVVDAFQAKYPDMEIEAVHGAAGDLKARLEFEKDAPNADVMFGGLTFADATVYGELFDVYVSASDETLPAPSRNISGKITVKSVNPNVLLVNNQAEAELGITVEGLQDLLNPALKGKIAMADPGSSATAYRWLTCILYAVGKGDPDNPAAWFFVEALIQNLNGDLASSGATAHRGVYEGNYVVGLTTESNATAYLRDGLGSYVHPVYAAEGTTAPGSGAAIIKNGPNPENARAFIDFISSESCQALYAGSSVRPANTALPCTDEYLPAITLIDEDIRAVTDRQQEFLDRFNSLWAKYN